ESIDQRQPKPRTVLHHRFIYGCRFRRCREYVGVDGRRDVNGSCQRTAGTLCRCRPGQDFRTDCVDSLHSAPSARIVPANRPRLGEPVGMLQYTLWISARKDYGTAWFMGALALIAISVPLLNQVVPAS